MKKWFTRIAVILAFVLSVFCLVGCGGGTNVEGVYKFKSITVEGVTYTAGQEMYGIIITENYMVIEVKSDKTVAIKMTAGTETEEATGTWAVNAEDSSKIDMTIDGETQAFTLSGNTLTMTNEYQTLVLEKK